MPNRYSRIILENKNKMYNKLEELISGISNLCGDSSKLGNIDLDVYNWVYLHSRELNLCEINFSITKKYTEYYFKYECQYDGVIDEFSLKVYNLWENMSSEEILNDIISRSKNSRAKDKQREIEDMMFIAKRLGYVCVKDSDHAQ